MEKYLYEIIKKTMIEMDLPDDTCAISFLVNANEMHRYGKYANLPEFVINYSTKSDLEDADEEEKWNCPLWESDHEVWIIDYEETENANVDALLKWLLDTGIENIGEEDFENGYDSTGNYIGKGPEGCYELTMLVSKIAKRLQEEGFLKEQVGKEIPIIICDYEFTWYVIEATQNANPDYLIEEYIKFVNNM